MRYTDPEGSKQLVALVVVTFECSGFLDMNVNTEASKTLNYTQTSKLAVGAPYELRSRPNLIAVLSVFEGASNLWKTFFSYSSLVSASSPSCGN